MNRIGLVGIDWRQGGPEGLVPYTIPADRRAEALPALADRIDVAELVYLATCNRVEVVFVGDGTTPVATYRQRIFRALREREPQPREAETELRAWGGEGAAEHLFLVASGLESAMLGEREIVGQMREALELSRRVGVAGPILEWLFQEAWKVSRDAHRATGVGEGKVSLAEIALARVQEHLREAPGAVGLVGVSPMTSQCGAGLAAEGVPVLWFNRTPARAREAAAEIDARGYGLDALRSGAPPEELSALVLATASEESVLQRPDLERLAVNESGRPLLVVDLATPPDVDPEEARLAGVRRIGMEEILAEAEAHRRAREEAGRAARRVVDQALHDLDDKLVDQALGPMFAALQRRYRVTAEKGVERLLRKELGDLGPEAEEAIRRWAEVLARRFAHIPTTGLRAVAKSHGFEALESFFSEGDEMLAEELRRIREDADRPLPRGLRIESGRGGAEEVLR